MNASNIAVFVDVENLTHWVKHSGPENLFEELDKKGSTIVRKAYGNWSNASISSLQVSLDRLGFDLSHNFHPISGKNSADIQFTIDVVECALRMPEIDCYVLATGDSDFSPLFRKLRNMGKEVIGVGPKSPLSKSVQSSCSHYIYTDTQTRPSRQTGSGYNRAAALARNTLRNLNGYAQCLELKKRMLEIDPTFDEKKHGFPTFRKFLEYIPAIRLTPISGSRDVIAYIDRKGPATTATSPENGTSKALEATPPLLENKESISDMYQRFLRTRYWHPVAKHPLLRVYHTLAELEPLSREDMENTLTDHLQDEVNWSTIRNCVTIFMKSGLFTLTLKGEEKATESKLWKLEKRENYIRDIDFSLLTRLIASIEENCQAINCTVINTLLYGHYTDGQLEQLISDASTKLTTPSG